MQQLASEPPVQVRERLRAKRESRRSPAGLCLSLFLSPRAQGLLAMASCGLSSLVSISEARLEMARSAFITSGAAMMACVSGRGLVPNNRVLFSRYIVERPRRLWAA